jgi:AraC family transcriptional regulator
VLGPAEQKMYFSTARFGVSDVTEGVEESGRVVDNVRGSSPSRSSPQVTERMDNIEKTFAKRFRLSSAPTLLSQRGSGVPIAISRLTSEDALDGPTRAMPAEDAYTFQVAIASMPAGDIWLDGRHGVIPAAMGGDTFVFDLAALPVAHLRKPYDFVRFYLPVGTMNQLAYEEGVGPIDSLRSTSVGMSNPVMHGLGLSILPKLLDPNAASALFVDSIALAFHAHVIHGHAKDTRARVGKPLSLAPWQMRRALEYIEAHLDGDPSISQIATECELSSGHFARAFRRSLGVPPHRWLIQRRIELAKRLLAHGKLSLSEIALACGFVDQSHLSRVFSRRVGQTPGRWRRIQQR